MALPPSVTYRQARNYRNNHRDNYSTILLLSLIWRFGKEATTKLQETPQKFWSRTKNGYRVFGSWIFTIQLLPDPGRPQLPDRSWDCPGSICFVYHFFGSGSLNITCDMGGSGYGNGSHRNRSIMFAVSFKLQVGRLVQYLGSNGLSG